MGLNPLFNPLTALTNPLLLAPAATPAKASRVVSLLQMVTEDDLKDDNEYKEILDDIEQECKSYGNVVSVIIPRPGQPGCGKVFVEYTNVEEAQRAIKELQGRTFADRFIIAGHFSEERYKVTRRKN